MCVCVFLLFLLGEAIDAAIEFHIDNASEEYKDILAARNKTTFKQAHEQVRSLFHPPNPPSSSSSSSMRGRDRGSGGGDGGQGDCDYNRDHDDHNGVREHGDNNNNNIDSNKSSYDKDSRGRYQGYGSKVNYDQNNVESYSRHELDENDVRRRDRDRDRERDINSNNINYDDGTYRGVHDIAPSIPPSVYRSNGHATNTLPPPYPYSENGKTVSNNGFREVIDIERDMPDSDGNRYGQMNGRELHSGREKEREREGGGSTRDIGNRNFQYSDMDERQTKNQHQNTNNLTNNRSVDDQN